MKDTSPEIEAKFNEMWMSLSPEERFKKACGMFDDAKALAIAEITAKETLTPEELRCRLFLWFYGNDFNEADREKILAYLRKT